MLPALFPADRLQACFRDRGLALFKGTRRENEVKTVAIRFCHWADGTHEPWAGFRSVVRELRTAVARGESPRPTLILGVHSLKTLRGRPEAMILDWPGAAYVRYDTSDGDLRAAVEQAIQGAREQLPARLLPDVSEILKMGFDIRHWLQPQLDAAEGAVADLDSVICGGADLHESYLKPVGPISRQHREVLEQFWSLEVVVASVVPGARGLQAIKTAIDRFERRWDDLEQARRDVRDCLDDERKAAMTRFRDRYIEVRQALLTAITAIDELDTALRKFRE